MHTQRHKGSSSYSNSSPLGTTLSSVSLCEENREDLCAITHLLLTPIYYLFIKGTAQLLRARAAKNIDKSDHECFFFFL